MWLKPGERNERSLTCILIKKDAIPALLAVSAPCAANSHQPEWECAVSGGAPVKRYLLLLYAVYSLFPDISCLISQSIVTSFLIPCSLNFFSRNIASINHRSQSREQPVKLIYTTFHQFVQIEDVTMPVVVRHFFQVDLSSIEIFCREDHRSEERRVGKECRSRW